MRIAILGDIHANYEALQAVLDDARCRGVDQMYHVGDVVGYCTDFGPCIDRLRAERIQGVHGNHDLMALGRLETTRCVPSGRQAIEWTRARLTHEACAYLQTLPPTLSVGEMIFFHAWPDSAERPISTTPDAKEAFELLARRWGIWKIAFHGHTHKQRVFEWNGEVRLLHAGAGRVELSPGARYLVSAGSVGQSRDQDPRTGYLIYDTRGFLEVLRLPYDWVSCERKIGAAGLTTQLYAPRPRFIPRIKRRLKAALRAACGG